MMFLKRDSSIIKKKKFELKKSYISPKSTFSIQNILVISRNDMKHFIKVDG